MGLVDYTESLMCLFRQEFCLCLWTLLFHAIYDSIINYSNNITSNEQSFRIWVWAYVFRLSSDQTMSLAIDGY